MQKLMWLAVVLAWGCSDGGASSALVDDDTTSEADATPGQPESDIGQPTGEADAADTVDSLGTEDAGDPVDAVAPQDDGVEPRDSQPGDTPQSDATAREDSRESDARASDATDTDGQADIEEPDDVGPPPDCPDGPPLFDYGCSTSNPSTCPGGFCVLGLCLGPQLDPDRWADCANGTCEPCETAASCPADCAEVPVIEGKVHNDPNTLTIWVHGFRNVSAEEFEAITYGDPDGCGGTLNDMGDYGVTRPCGNTPETELLPNHVIKVEYFGTQPAAWLTPEQIADIEAYDWKTSEALQRYAAIVAAFIEHRLEISGANHVNMACHSMGCLIIRHVIENDLLGLASQGKIARWSSSAGVVAGARLARLYDNPSVQDTADLLGLAVSEFAFMNPDYVMDYSAAWDHRLYEGNSPYFNGIAIHHHTATDPKIEQALDIQLLDLNNPGDEPNDGIMYTLDQYFHDQGPLSGVSLPSGKVLQATNSAGHVDHMNLPDTDAFTVLTAAGLYHARRVRIEISNIELLDDLELGEIGEGDSGVPPAEVSAEVVVRYNPYVLSEFGKDVLIHESRREHRNAELFEAEQGVALDPDYVIFEGPVFDAMTSLDLAVSLREVDWYPRFGVLEWAFDVDDTLVDWSGSVPLEDGEITFQSGNAVVTLSVDVFSLY